MALKEFKKLNIKDFETSRLQENVSDMFNQLVNNPRLSGILIENVDLVFGQVTTVDHGLGRKIVGFEIVYKNNSVEVWAEDSKQILPLRTLVLDTNADATVNLWVY